MRSDDGGAAGPEPFAGDLLLRLAVEGWLVLSREEAERIVAELESTLTQVRARLRRVSLSRRLLDLAGGDVPSDVDGLVVESAFAGQIAADRWEQALIELPKYIQALRIAGDCR